ncbi:hypothetical protein [Aestuariivivens sediminis]|uniref:hypothetical protein n=1 Tax=Aestuariivivens sediminis TaxID=2913557 RepID=UPI001F584E78|nr:hypothetical protein [Aestuariivivens sediminis]
MKSIVLWICALISFTAYSQRVEIPDKNFEQTLIDLKIDSDGLVNGYLLKRDAELMTSLDISNRPIKDLTGIEAFTSLLYLYCFDNQLSHLDLKDNTGLMVVLTDVNELIPPNGMILDMLWFD